jgi:hypothetical protein
MKNKVLMGFAAIVMVAFLSSCGKVPQAQIDAVNASIDSAAKVEAGIYLPTEYAAVQDSMKTIMADVEVQKSKLFKKFGPAKIKLEALLAQTNQLVANTAVKKEEVKKEVETTMTDIKTIIEENGKLFKKAPRGKEGAAVLEQIKTEMATIDAAVVEAQASYDKATYMDALNKIKAAKERATGINTELKDAIAKVHKR